MMLRLLEKYKQEVIPKMKEKFGYRNNMEVPKLVKVIVNTGFGKMIMAKTSDERKKVKKTIIEDFSLICGQCPTLTKAKKSIAGFKLREGMEIGVKATLRKKKMYDFLDRLIHIILPRSRDFQGIKLESIDEQGNLTIAIKEHISFPEVSPEKSRFIFGLEVTIVTDAKNKEKSLELFRLLGFPIKK